MSLQIFRERWREVPGGDDQAPRQFTTDLITPSDAELLTLWDGMAARRWLELVYPKTRWEKERRPAFEKWGAMTDGECTPWSEWYDLDKLRRRMAPETWRTILDFDFQGTDFHWFDLQRLE